MGISKDQTEINATSHPRQKVSSKMTSLHCARESCVRKKSAAKNIESLQLLTRCKGFRRKPDQLLTKKSAKLKVRTDRSAVVLVSIVILFLITHCYRLALKVYEVASPNAQTMETFKICFALKRYEFMLLFC